MKYSITTSTSTKTPLTFEKLNPGDVFMINNDTSSLFLVLHDRYAPLEEGQKDNSYFGRYNAVSLTSGKCTTVKPTTRVKLLVKDLFFNESDFMETLEELLSRASTVDIYTAVNTSSNINKVVLNEKVDKEKSSKLDELMKDFEISYYSYPNNIVN